MDNHKYTEVESFLREFIKQVDERNIHEKMFIERVLGEFIGIHLNNYTMNFIQDIKILDIYGLASFCSHEYIYNIFKEIKNLLINEIYLIDLNNIIYINNINYSDTNIKICSVRASDCLYIYSINKIIYQIMIKFHNNYDQYITNENKLNDLINKYDTYIYKYNLSWFLKFNTNDRYNDKFPLEKYIYNFGLYVNSSNNQLTYDIYLDIYNFFLTYLNNLNDIEKLKSTKIKKLEIKDNSELKDKIKKSSKKSSNKLSTTESLTDSLNDIELKDDTNIILKKKKKSIPLALKRKVWNKYITEEIGKAKCLCCNLTDITQTTFSCGHIISEFNGGEIKLDNLKPICTSCNSSMGTKNMDEFIKDYGL
jgi:5-methylcytosine-specific restriction endonuclease McrA